MKNQKIYRWLPWVVAAMVLVSGCSGVLMESKDNSSGKVERLKLDSGESWDSYDDRPRHPYVTSGKQHGLDDLSIMLKTESTF